MEFLFYLVLILALLSFAGFMLYVRFAAGRDRALHHSPLAVDTESENSQLSGEIVEAVVDEIEAEDLVPDELPAIRAEAIGAEKKEDERKSEYLDELQEAAAGLAMLMRSSASNRTTPVVFAPEEEEDSPAAAPVQVAESEEVIEAVAEFEPEEEAATEPEKKTLAMLLGTDVAEQFEKIDSDLDALEALVVSIESGLSVLAPVEEVEDASEESGGVELTEAA